MGTNIAKKRCPGGSSELSAGCVTVWLGDKFLCAATRPGRGTRRWNRHCGMPWAIDAALFTPGAMLGGIIGWFIIGPVNAALALFFRLFNRLFDRVIAIYGKVVGGLLRISAIALARVRRLAGRNCWQFIRTPTGFMPQQDKGYLLLNVQLPDSASVERTQAIDGPHRRSRRPRAGRGASPSAFPGNR